MLVNLEVVVNRSSIHEELANTELIVDISSVYRILERPSAHGALVTPEVTVDSSSNHGESMITETFLIYPVLMRCYHIYLTIRWGFCPSRMTSNN